MSEFYKQIRNDIIKNYKYLGMKDKISFYSYRLLMILMIILLVLFFPALLVSIKSWLLVFIVIPIILVLHIISIYDNKKYQENKRRAITDFIKQKNVTIEVTEILISEIENSVKKSKTFASWIAGLSASCIILLATLCSNYFMKIIDVCVQIIPENELINMINGIDYNSIIIDYVETFLLIGILLLTNFIGIIIIIYNVFSIITFIKKQILLFLFDVRYELLIREEKLKP